MPTGKTTELLVRLALDAGAPVRADVLVEDLWGEPVGRNTLQSKVSQLRRALGDRGLVPGSGDAYRLVVDPSGVDAFAVADLAAEASAARAAGDPALAARRAAEGLALFRGDVLVDAGDWAHPHRVRLDELRMGLLEDLLAARVELGSGGDVVAELEALVERYPLREGLWASLITALYRAGRQADALGGVHARANAPRRRARRRTRCRAARARAAGAAAESGAGTARRMPRRRRSRGTCPRSPRRSSAARPRPPTWRRWSGSTGW